MTNEHTSLEKYTSQTFIRKGCERVVCGKWVGDWTDCNILTPSSSDYSSTSFSFCWAAQPGVLRAQALCWELVLTASNCNSNFKCNWLQLTQLSVAPGYITVWHPPASFECRICTEFNPSTVKVISGYLRPDAPVSRLSGGSKVNMLQKYQYSWFSPHISFFRFCFCSFSFFSLCLLEAAIILFLLFLCTYLPTPLQYVIQGQFLSGV